jgi:hypothetical protein
VRNSGLGLQSSRLAITDTRVVNHTIERAELVDCIRHGPRPGNGREIAGNDALGARSRRESVAAATFISSMQNNLMALLDQQPRRH